jgi:hypothetical protein
MLFFPNFRTARKSVINSLGSMVRVEDDDVVIPSEYLIDQLSMTAGSKSIEFNPKQGQSQQFKAGVRDSSQEFKAAIRREQKSLRLSQGSYEDYKKMLDSSMEFKPTKGSSSTNRGREEDDSMQALRKSIQKRDYEDIEEDEETPRFDYFTRQRPVTAGKGNRSDHSSALGGGGRYSNENMRPTSYGESFSLYFLFSFLI